MEPRIKLHRDLACSVILEDITNYIPEYEKSVLICDTYKASECIVIDAVFRNRTDNSELVDCAVNNKVEPLKIQFEFDGWGVVLHIIIPNKEWVECQMNKENSVLSYYNIVYYSDGKKFYKIYKDEISEVKILEILEVNPEGTTILKTHKDFVSMCSLKLCYIDTCKRILERNINKCHNESDIKELIYQRDVLWMVINVVNYLVEFENFAEAERIIENVLSCGQFCKLHERIKPLCGCRR